MVQQPGKLQMIISNNNTTYQAQEAALEAGATEEAQAAAEEAQAAAEAQSAEATTGTEVAMQEMKVVHSHRPSAWP